MSYSLLLSIADQDCLLLDIYSYLPGFVRGKARNQDLEDAVHDVVTDCLVKLRGGVWMEAPRNIQAFVRRLVRDYAYDRRRQRMRLKEHDAEHLASIERTPPEWVSPDSSDIDDYIAEFRRRVLANVPERWRATFYLVRDQGMSYDEAASRLDVLPATICSYIVKVNRAFREEFRALGIGVPAPYMRLSSS